VEKKTLTFIANKWFSQ